MKIFLTFFLNITSLEISCAVSVCQWCLILYLKLNKSYKNLYNFSKTNPIAPVSYSSVQTSSVSYLILSYYIQHFVKKYGKLQIKTFSCAHFSKFNYPNFQSFLFTARASTHTRSYVMKQIQKTKTLKNNSIMNNIVSRTHYVGTPVFLENIYIV